MDNPLDITALTPHFHTLGSFLLCHCRPCLHLISVPVQTDLKQSENRRTTCKGASVLFQHVKGLAFLYSTSLSPISRSFSCPCRVFVENIYVQYVVWPSKGQLVALSPLGVRVCACAWAYAWICLLSYVCMTHLCLTGNHTAAGSEPKEKGGKNNKTKDKKTKQTKEKNSVLQSLTLTHTHQLK